MRVFFQGRQVSPAGQRAQAALPHPKRKHLAGTTRSIACIGSLHRNWHGARVARVARAPRRRGTQPPRVTWHRPLS